MSKITDNLKHIHSSRLLTIYPEEYGAVGDGTTDDTVALQAALDALEDGMTLEGSGIYCVDTTGIISIDHEGFGTTSQYYAGLLLDDRENVTVRLHLKELAVSTTYMEQMLILQNVRFSTFDMKFTGLTVFQDGWDNDTNPLDDFGTVGIRVTDKCHDLTFNLENFQMRYALGIHGYDDNGRAPVSGSYQYFADENCTYNVHITENSTDVKYGPFIEDTDNVTAKVNIVNCKRSCRFGGSKNARMEVNTSVRDKLSWSEFQSDVLMYNSTTHDVENVHVNVTRKNKRSWITLEAGGRVTGVCRNIWIHTEESAGGGIWLKVREDAAGQTRIIENVTISGNWADTDMQPFILLDADVAGSDADNVFRYITFRDITFETDDGSCNQSPIKFNYGPNFTTKKYQNITIDNVIMKDTVNGTLADTQWSEMKQGAFVFAGISNLNIHNLDSVATDLSGDDEYGIYNCLNVNDNSGRLFTKYQNITQTSMGKSAYTSQKYGFIHQLLNTLTDNTTLKGLWFFDDFYNGTISDYSGNGNTITFRDSSLTEAPAGDFVGARYGRALMLETSSSYTWDAADSDTLSFVDGGGVDVPFTIIWYGTFEDATSKVWIAKNSNDSDTEYVMISGGSDNLFFYCYDHSSGGRIGRGTSAITAYEGVPTSIIVTYDGTQANSGIKIYVNGTQLDTTDGGAVGYVNMENLTAKFAAYKTETGGATRTYSPHRHSIIAVIKEELDAGQVNAVAQGLKAFALV